MEIFSMVKLFFGLNQSLDGYVDHQEFAPGPSLFRHFYEQVRDLTGSVYGRRMACPAHTGTKSQYPPA
jgi:hypothetical protein